MPKLKMPGPAADPNRTSSQAPGALKLTPSPAEKTVIMTESEKQTAARLRDRSASQLKATSSMPQIAAPPPPPPPTRPLPRPVTARVTLPPPPPPTLAAPRPSILPKVLLGVFVFLGLLGIGLGVLFFAKPRGSEAPQAETWNNLPVYPEADVDKSPLLFSHEVPKPKLEPGRVVSVTVSWIVTPEGLVDDPRIETSASPEIDAFVVEAVKKWRYEPGQKAGKTVPVRVLRKYTFGQRTSSQNP
jgi:TonB family protein